MSQALKKDSPEQADFRTYCREWLSKHDAGTPTVRLPQSAIEIMHTEQLDYLRQWQQQAYEAGMIGCDYPVAEGGGGRKNCQRWPEELSAHCQSRNGTCEQAIFTQHTGLGHGCTYSSLPRQAGIKRALTAGTIFLRRCLVPRF